MSVEAALWINIAILFCVTACQIASYPKLATVIRDPAPRQYDIPTWRYTSFGLWMNNTQQQGFHYVSLVLLGLLLNPSMMGGFFAAAKTSLLLNFFLLAINLVSAPHIARMWQQGEKHDLQRLCSAVAAAAFVPTLILFCIFVVFGTDILRLFGEDFVSAYPVLIILSVSQLINTVCGQTGTILTMTGNERTQLKFVFLSNAATVVLLVLGTPILGQTFAALAVAFGLLGWTIAAAVWSTRHLGINPTLLGLFMKSKSA